MTNSDFPDQSTVGVIVLGAPGSLRNPELEKIDPDVRFVPPVFFQNDKRVGFDQYLREFFLNGRVLNWGERGCSQAHINIRAEIMSSPNMWTLVLEDDVGLPADWLSRLDGYLPGFPDSFTPSVVLLNTDPYLNFGPGVTRLDLQPSYTNAYLVHRSCLEPRPYRHLDALQIADWPCSFSGVSFFTLSNIAFDLQFKSTIGARPASRLLFLISTVVRGIFSPFIALFLSLPLKVYLSWCVLGPIKRDLSLRLRWFLN
jgi:hypothetical protein